MGKTKKQYEVPIDEEQFTKAFCGSLFHPYVTELYYKVVDYAMHIHFGGLSFNAEAYPVRDYERALSLAILLKDVSLHGVMANGFSVTEHYFTQSIAEGYQQALSKSIEYIQAATTAFLVASHKSENRSKSKGGIIFEMQPAAWAADSHNNERIKYEDHLGELFVRHTYDIPLSLPTHFDVDNLVFPYEQADLDEIISKIQYCRDASAVLNSISEDFPMSFFLCSVFSLPVKPCNQAYQEIYDALLLMELIPEDVAKSHASNTSPYAARNYIKSKVLRLVKAGYIEK